MMLTNNRRFSVHIVLICLGVLSLFKAEESIAFTLLPKPQIHNLRYKCITNCAYSHFLKKISSELKNMANDDDISECTSSTIDFSRIERIFAISDLHTDNADNLSWLVNRCQCSENENENANTTPGPNDILIIAGDISHELSKLKDTFDIILENLQCTIFFVPGNHEAWIGGTAMDKMGITSSIQKLDMIRDLCISMDKVEIHDRLIGSAHKSPVWLIPLQG